MRARCAGRRAEARVPGMHLTTSSTSRNQPFRPTGEPSR
jgi:hypothetical protein